MSNSVKIKNCFDRLQTLNIPPTLSNQETLLQTLYDLREVYVALKKEEEEKESVGNAGIETAPSYG